jgi:putative glutamine amidotransferase
MARPVIGICAALERARWSVWDQQVCLLPRNYVDAVQQAGGLALMVPVDPLLAEDPDEVLDLIDGLMLAGGADIDPSFYGAEPDPQTVDTVPERDAFEIALARRAIARDLPVLGICRGMQLINVACGGSLLQHLPERFGHHEHRRVVGSFDGADHDVVLLEGSLAARAAGELTHATKSHHHQGVDRLGEGLRVSARSTLDELPEAIEWDGRSPPKQFLLGVQWHPEADAQSRVVGALIAAAGARVRSATETANDGDAVGTIGDGLPHHPPAHHTPAGIAGHGKTSSTDGGGQQRSAPGHDLSAPRS